MGLDTKLASTTSRLGTSDAFFRGLSKRAEKIANDESFVMADNMVYILKFRKQLKGNNGVFPKWDGSNGIASKNSHKDWIRIKYGKHFAIKHTSKGEWDSYYPDLLIRGGNRVTAPRGWFESAVRRTTQKNEPTKLVITNGRVFSSQMPNGLNPWLKIKREDLKNNIRKEFKRLGVKK